MSKGGGVDIPSDYTFKIGNAGSPLAIDADLDNIRINNIAPLTSNTNLTVTQPIITDSTSKAESDSKASITIAPLTIAPLTVNSDSRSAVESKSEIDLKPVVLDSCQTIKLAPLPPIRVEQPYSQHFGITFMGMELWGLNISGTSQINLHSPQKPHPCPPAATSIPRETPRPQDARSTDPTPSGLRVRVSGQ